MTRTLFDLVYEPAGAYVERVAVEGERFRLVTRAGSKLSPKVLAETLRFGNLASVAVDGRDLLVTTTDGSAPLLSALWFEVGPFQQSAYIPDKLLVLRRRGGEGLQRIEVHKFESQDEEWRRFLAREVDISLFLTEGTLTYLRDVPTVRVVPIEQSPDVALHFRTDSPIFQDREMRRFVAARIRRPAIAQMATGERGAALAPPNVAAEAEPGGKRVRLIAFNGKWDQQQAALVLEQQFIEMGFTVTLVPSTLEEMDKALKKHDFDALVFYSGSTFSQVNAERYTTGHQANIPGYHNPEYDAAVAAGKLERAQEILALDVPFTPLYRSAEAVAIDRRFCGVHPKVNWDLSWLAEVHLCAPGEAQ